MDNDNNYNDNDNNINKYLEYNNQDNETSKLLKTAIKLDTPISLLWIKNNRLINPDLEEENIKSILLLIEEEVNNYLNSIKNLSQLYNSRLLDKLLLKYDKKSTIDIALIYYLNIRDNEEFNEKYNNKVDYEIILNNINNTLLKYKATKFDNLEDIDRSAEQLGDKIIKELDKNKLELLEILRIQEENINKNIDIYDTKYKITKTSVGVMFDISNIENPSEIFDNMRISRNIPFIKYVKNWKDKDIMIKLYKGDTPLEEVNLDNITWISTKSKNNIIYLTIHINNIDDKKYYLRAKYNITDNILLFDIREYNDKLPEILKYIEYSFNMKITSYGRTNLTAEFKFLANYDLYYDNVTLLYTMLNQPSFRKYVYVNERTNLSILNDPNKIYYKGVKYDSDNLDKLPVIAYIVLYPIYSTSVKNIELSNGKSIELKNKQKYLNIRISKLYSEKTIENIMQTLKILIYDYVNIYRDIALKRYYNIIDIKDYTNNIKSDELVSNDNYTLDNFPSMIKHIIEANYTSQELSTLLNKKYQYIPKNLNEKQLNEYMTRYFKFEPNLSFVTLSQEIRSKFNDIFSPILTDTDNKKILRALYPDLFIKNYSRHGKNVLLVKPDEIDLWQSFNVEGTNIKRQVLPFPYNNPMLYFTCDPSSNYKYPGWKRNVKLANSEKYPFIPSCYKELQVSEGGGKKAGYKNYMDYLETGILESSGKNLNLSINLDANRIGELPAELVNLIKNQIYKDNSINVVRYGGIYDKNSLLHVISDISTKEYNLTADINKKNNIVKMLREKLVNDVNLNIYKQELYDFSLEQIKEFILDTNNVFDPKYLYRGLEQLLDTNIYVFTYNIKKDILGLEIPRYRGTYIRPYTNRKCIFIYKYTGNVSTKLKYPNYNIIMVNNVKVHNEVINDNMYKIFNTYISNINIDSKHTIYYNLYNTLDIYSWLKQQKLNITSQLIDNYGKNRGFAINNELTIITPPSQPVNLENKIDYIYTTPDIINKYFKIKPNKITENGYYYNVGNIENYIFIPIKNNNNKILDDYQLYTKYYYERNIILNLLNWLYSIKHNSDLRFNDIDNFIKLILHEPVKGGIVDYNIGNIPEILPPNLSIEDAIKYIKELIPNLVYENKIYCYSEKFYNDMVYYIEFLHKNSYGIIINNSNVMKNIKSENSFITDNYYTFKNYTDYIKWISYKHTDKLHNKIKLSYAKYIGFYLYRDLNNAIYMIQNVVNNSLENALAVAETWQNNGYNLGFYVNEKSINNDNYVIYGVNLINQIEPIKINAKNDKYLRILQYYNNVYAAILPL